MKKIFFYLILLLSVSLYSCITYIDTEKDLGIKPKLVLFGYLVPQWDTTIVNLSSSAPLFTTNPKNPAPVANATVEISENNTTWTKLEWDTAYKRYFIPQTDFSIKEGSTYYIRAAAPEYETVYASCTVPYFRETNLKIDLAKTDTDIDNWFRYKGSFEWNDYPSEENYYMFCWKEFGEHIHYEHDWEYWEPPVSDTAYFFTWQFFWDTKNNTCLYSDFGQDGKKMTPSIDAWLPQDIVLTYLQTDKNCYLFEKSSENYDADLQGFVLEPLQLYSNVKNGYGVFGAFVLKDYELEF